MTMRILLFLFSLLVSLAHADEFLDPAVAFKPSVRALDGQTLEVSYEIAKGYYLYRDKFRVVADGDAATLGEPVLPKGKEKNDDNFGKVEVYYKTVALRVPVDRISSGPLTLNIKVTAQGCADAGVCYPPQTQPLSVSLPDPATTPSAAASASAGEGDESGMIAATLKDAGFWAILAFFFVAGLGLSLTPCVFPMIPILSGIIVGQGHKALASVAASRLSMAYVLGMAVTYAAAGVAAGLTGTLLSSALAERLGAGRFRAGFRRAVLVDVRLLRAAAADRPAEQAVGRIRPPAGRVAASASSLMGALSALIVGPCVAAPLAGALLYIGQTGDAVLGGTALFVMALGMGAPLIAVGVPAGSAAAEDRAVDGRRQEGLRRAAAGHRRLAGVAGAAADCQHAGLGAAAHRAGDLPARPRPAAAARQGLATLLEGHRHRHAAHRRRAADRRPGRQPRPAAAAGRPARHGHRGRNEASAFRAGTSVADLEAKIAAAGKPVMLDFYADWCVSCKEMEKFTFADPAVQAKLGRLYCCCRPMSRPIRPTTRLYWPASGCSARRASSFSTPRAAKIKAVRVVGFQNAEQFVKTLQKTGAAG